MVDGEKCNSLLGKDRSSFSSVVLELLPLPLRALALIPRSLLDSVTLSDQLPATQSTLVLLALRFMGVSEVRKAAAVLHGSEA